MIKNRKLLLLSVNEAYAEIGGKLGSPGKMPCHTGQSMPCETCPMGSKLAKIPGTVCSCCYGARGHYPTTNVQNRMWERYWALMTAFKDQRLDEYETAFVKAILNDVKDCFRWFDSGDLQGQWHLESIIRIVEEVTKVGLEVDHWIPTHEKDMIMDFIKTKKLPDNLLVRISGDYINQLCDDEVISSGLPMSVVYDKEKLFNAVGECKSKGLTYAICTAKVNPDGTPSRNNECGPCRLCWNEKIDVIIYPRH
jgi:hypothetical protein